MAVQVCQEHSRMISRLDAIDGKLDAMKDDFLHLWQNGPLTKINQQLASLEAKMDDKPTSSWVYALVGAAAGAMLGAEGIKALISLIK